MIRLRTVFILLLALSGGVLAAYLAARAVQRPPARVPVVRHENKTEPGPTPVPTPASFASGIPQGMRAVAVSVNTVTGVSRELHPGDLVDVVAVSPMGGKHKGHIARTILQSVPVFAVESADKGKGGTFQSSSGRWTVTLLVATEGARSLLAARDAAELSLAVRNPDDASDDASLPRIYTNTQGVETYEPPPANADVRRNIPKGMRVFTLPIGPTDGIGGNLVAGDRVDIIITCPFSKFTADLQVGSQGVVTETHMASSVLMQAIPVLAVDGAGEREQTPANVPSPSPDSSESPVITYEEPSEPRRTVSLLVTPQQAVTLATARDATGKSVLRLVTRHPDDDSRQATRRELLIDLLTERQYVNRRDVDVIRGNKVHRRRFYSKPEIKLPSLRREKVPDPRQDAMLMSRTGAPKCTAP